MRLAAFLLLTALCAPYAAGAAKTYRYFWNFEGAPKIGERGVRISRVQIQGVPAITTVEPYGDKPQIQEGLRYCRQICATQLDDGTFKPYSYESHSPASAQYAGLTSVTTMSKDGVLSTRSDLHKTDSTGEARWYQTASLDLRPGAYTFSLSLRVLPLWARQQ
jgi:hypothetical protein